MGLRPLLLRPLLLVWVLASPLAASNVTGCPEWLQRSAIPGVTVAVDFDGTVVDSDAYLIAHTIPAAVATYFDFVSPQARRQLEAFVERLQKNQGLFYPASYTQSHWACPQFGFPLDCLPEGVGLLDFWKRMSSIFKQQIAAGARLEVIGAFREFVAAVEALTHGTALWTLATARTRPLVPQAVRGWEEAGLPPLSGVLHGGEVAGRDSAENAARKVAQLAAYRCPQGRGVGIFFDNDPINLSVVARQCGPGVLPVLVRRRHPGHELVPADGLTSLE